MRPRSDQRHVPGQHVEELRYLVDVPASQEAADSGDARIAAGRLLAAVVDAVHGTKLDNVERLLIEAEAALGEEDRSAAIEANENRDGEEKRSRHNERRSRNGEVEQALLHDLEARKRPARDLQARDRAEGRQLDLIEFVKNLLRPESNVDRGQEK